MERQYCWILPYTPEELSKLINISAYRIRKTQKELEKKGYMIRDTIIVDGKKKRITRYADDLFYPSKYRGVEWDVREK